jgi:hypothetical protein
MVMVQRALLGLVLPMATWLGLAACGGAVSRDGGEPSSGGGGAGGASSGGGGGAVGRRDCAFGGEIHAHGTTFSIGCNDCACNDGEVACDVRACIDGCTYAGRQYAAGETFPEAGSCNTCTCEKDGTVWCTQVACPTCVGVASTYAAAVEDARRCDPQGTGQCAIYLAETVGCSCGVFVNGGQVDAIASAKGAASLYELGDCAGGICGNCARPLGSYCSSEGSCEDILPYGAACKVGGIVYPSGANGIPDPSSCNECTCADGRLVCTEIGCPLPCPPDRAPASQCALCGEGNACAIVEHGCLPTCGPGGSACAQGTCVDGVCQNLCE